MYYQPAYHMWLKISCHFSQAKSVDNSNNQLSFTKISCHFSQTKTTITCGDVVRLISQLQSYQPLRWYPPLHWSWRATRLSTRVKTAGHQSGTRKSPRVLQLFGLHFGGVLSHSQELGWLVASPLDILIVSWWGTTHPMVNRPPVDTDEFSWLFAHEPPANINPDQFEQHQATIKPPWFVLYFCLAYLLEGRFTSHDSISRMRCAAQLLSCSGANCARWAAMAAEKERTPGASCGSTTGWWLQLRVGAWIDIFGFASVLTHSWLIDSYRLEGLKPPTT